MEVVILETIRVQPSKPPFSETHTLPLSHLDTDRNLDVTCRYLRAYANTNNNVKDPCHVIATALSSALVHYYPLAATLRRRHLDDRLEVYCCQEQLGLPLVNATANCRLEEIDYLNDPEPEFLERLAPEPDLDGALANPFWLQVTVFKCGGFVLGTCVHHAMCDGLGATLFFNATAELGRGAGRVSADPVWSRADLLGPRDPPMFGGVVREFLSLEKGFKPYGNYWVGKVVWECFDVKETWVDQLKKELLEKSGSAFTTFEALGAFIWRAKVKAYGIPGDEEVKFAYSIDIRKLVKPPLPAGYWGNGCVPMYAKALAREIIEQPIWITADLIKKSKRNANDEYIRSFIDFQEVHYRDGITAGGCRVSGFTDWRHLGHSTVDFGWGGPVTVLPLSKRLLGSTEPCFFLPHPLVNSRNREGFKVALVLQEAALPSFRSDMEKFKTQEFE